ncbi:hypothetical protein F0919_01425 [Taibaiella lutea]|uniref:histidine kinase n=1 Tax=Taibaiella lutea TaxID=2608001 RepID=A0A5M6CMW6_9BACT|nr:ATP-binding protein [Taibaiella lutea]KAA5536356.1 hypothetical protein F0919_01425 [Taibaiella lutea]
MQSDWCFGRNLFAFLFLLIITGCGNPKGNKSQCITEYKKISTQQVVTLKDVYKTMRLYDSIDEACHSNIAQPVINDLFTVVYSYQTYDTVIIPFLNKIAEEKNISVQDRSIALLRITTYYLYGLQDKEKAVPYLERATRYFPEMNDSVKKVYYSINGELSVEQSNLKEAARYYLKAIEIAEKQKDSSALMSNLSNYSTVYSRMREYKKAAEIKKEVLKYFLNKKDYNNLIYGYIGVGTEYGLLRDYDSAIHYFLLGIDLVENKGVVNPNIAFSLYTNIGGINLGLSRYDSAAYYYSKAKEQLAALKNEDHERFYIMSSAPAFAKVRSVEPELKIIKGYLDEYSKNNDYQGLSNVNYALYHIYFMQDDYHQSLRHFITYDSLKSLIADEENQQYVAEMDAKYETQKKQLKIEVQQREIKKQRAITGLLIAVLLVLALSTALFFARQKLKRNKREADLQQQFTRKLMENTEEERIRIARDLHDGVSQELMILKNQMPNENQAHKQRIDAIINEIRLISRDLHPVMLEKIGLKASVEHICNQLMEANMIFISSEIDYNNSLDKNGELQMFRMIQEALNNIIKYSQAQAAKVTINENAKYVVAEIIDNGNGFDVEAAMNSKNSFGLLNLKERSKALNGKTSISSSTSGTKIKIEIPKING